MNPRTKRKMDKINDRLEKYKQKVRIVEISTSSILLNNGNLLVDNDAGKFTKRIMNSKVDAWVKNIDALLSGAMNESEIKKISFAIGGKACQKKHSEKIKLNLNTGIPWNKGTKGQQIGKYGPMSSEVKEKISEKNKGKNNGRYGYVYSNQEKIEKSFRMKELIRDGKFTPKLNNRNTHWESTLDGVAFRSSWEALYKYINQNANYEELRIPYHYNDVMKIYIVDFVDHLSRTVIEIKPKELCVGNKFAAKLNALTTWANINLYKVLLIDKNWLQNQVVDVDYTRFDEKTACKIRKLYEINKKN